MKYVRSEDDDTVLYVGVHDPMWSSQKVRFPSLYSNPSTIRASRSPWSAISGRASLRDLSGSRRLGVCFRRHRHFAVVGVSYVGRGD